MAFWRKEQSVCGEIYVYKISASPEILIFVFSDDVVDDDYWKYVLVLEGLIIFIRILISLLHAFVAFSWQ